MRIYLRNNPAKFHPNPILETTEPYFFENGRPKKNKCNKKNKKMTSDMGLIPDPKTV